MMKPGWTEAWLETLRVSESEGWTNQTSIPGRAFFCNLREGV